MFRPGQVFKVKVELSPDEVGFGRATIVDCKPKHIVFQLRTSHGGKQAIPKGTRIWFVGNANDNRMNGLWGTIVTDTRLYEGKHAFECKTPVFEPFRNLPEQRRRHKRATIQVPVKLNGTDWKDLERCVLSRNISRSGLGLSVLRDCPHRFPPGMELSVVLKTTSLEVELQGAVINTRYNWLLNQTEVGLEFRDLPANSVDSLDKILLWLGSKPRKEEVKSESGALAGWLKSSKESRRFLGAQGAGTAAGATQTEAGADGEFELEESDEDEEREDSDD